MVCVLLVTFLLLSFSVWTAVQIQLTAVGCRRIFSMLTHNSYCIFLICGLSESHHTCLRCLTPSVSFHKAIGQNMDIHSDYNEQHGLCYRPLLATVGRYSPSVSDGFCVIIGCCRINEEAGRFPVGANLSSYKLVILSI